MKMKRSLLIVFHFHLIFRFKRHAVDNFVTEFEEQKNLGKVHKL